MIERFALHLSFCESYEPEKAGVSKLYVRFDMGTKLSRRIAFSSSGAQLTKNGDALLCFGLRPAIELGVDLHIHSSVSQDLLDRSGEIQTTLCKWYRGSKPIRIFVDDQRSDKPQMMSAAKSAVFYSGGVDSSFTLLKKVDVLSAVITIVGADVSPHNIGQAAHLNKLSNDVAKDFDLERILVSTDIRKTTDRLIGWVEYHGAFLAEVGHLLCNDIGEVLIASSADESSWNRPWGSHPGLDPLWSTDKMKVGHHGLVDRLKKIETIINNATLMRNLRVCDYDDNNCGKCEDCNFMLQALEVLNARSNALTFQSGDASKIMLPVTGEGSFSDLLHLQRAAEAKHDHKLVAEIEKSLRVFRAKRALSKILDLNEIASRFKRFKRRQRYKKACETGAFYEAS